MLHKMKVYTKHSIKFYKKIESIFFAPTWKSRKIIIFVREYCLVMKLL